MPRGGYRPGAGRKPSAPKPPNPGLAEVVEKKPSARGGKREGAGRGGIKAALRKARPAPVEMVHDLVDLTRKDETPLEYMLRVMRDPREAIDRRDKMAISVAPYLHPKLQGVAFQFAPPPGAYPGAYPKPEDQSTEQEKMGKLDLARRIAYTMAMGARLAKKPE